MSPLDLWPELRFALRRSRIRGAILLALLKLDQAYLSELARLVGTVSRHARGALEGADEEEYRIEHSLLRLGLVARRRVAGRYRYRLTDFGRVVAIAWRDESQQHAEAKPLART